MSRRAFLNATRNARKGGGGNKKFMPFGLKQVEFNIGDEGMLRSLDFGDEVFTFRQHWLNKKPVICTCDLEHFDGKCVGCYHHEAKVAEMKAAGEKPDSPYYASTKFVTEWIDFRYHHVIPDPDKQNRLKLVDCGHSEPELPSKVRCKYCRNKDKSISERHFGGRKVWEMGKNLFVQYSSVNDQCAEQCIHVDEDGGVCGDEVYTLGYKCSSCDSQWIDQEGLDEMSEDDFIEFIDNDHTCDNCKEEVEAAPILECKSEAHEAVPCEVFDKNIGIRCFGTDKRQYEFHYGDSPSNPVEDIMEYINTQTGVLFTEEEAETLVTVDAEALAKKYLPERIDPSKYNTPEGYVSAVLAKQAERSGLSNPYKGETKRSLPFNKSGSSKFRRK